MRLLLATCVALAASTGAFSPTYCEQFAGTAERWDLRIIDEAPIWSGLLVDYAYADRAKHWPDRKAALQTTVDEFPESRWADDARLLLAGGQASIEGDVTGAIASLRAAMDKYPLEQTVVGSWAPDLGCLFDAAWLSEAPGLVILDADGSVRATHPYDRDGLLSPQDRETLAYFAHLERHPRLTKDTAQLIIAQMLFHQGEVTAAIAGLEALISRYPDLAAINAADREAAANPDGYLIAHEPIWYLKPIWRPQYQAYCYLMEWCALQGDKDKAVATGLQLVSLCTPDGWDWYLNRHVGRVLSRNDRWAEAAEQFRLALQGLRRLIQDEAARNQAAYEAGLMVRPLDFVSWEDEALKAHGDDVAGLEQLLDEPNRPFR